MVLPDNVVLFMDLIIFNSFYFMLGRHYMLPFNLESFMESPCE